MGDQQLNNLRKSHSFYSQISAAVCCCLLVLEGWVQISCTRPALNSGSDLVVLMSFDHPLFSRLKEYNFVLGSSSPRRREILAQNINIADFSVVKSTFEENLSKESSDVEYVTTTAAHKIESIVEQLEPGHKYILLVADTVVSCGGRIFEKPETPSRQLDMLRHYRSHPNDIRVITAVHLCEIDATKTIVKRLLDYESTSLCFRADLSDAQLQYYVDSEEGLEVAGGFKYQSLGCLLFSGIQGDYFNVVGLPAAKTFSMLELMLC